MANPIDKAVEWFAPAAALRRAQARKALEISANYNATKLDRRRGTWRTLQRGDADYANRARGELSAISLDLIRNTPLARQGQRVIANNVVGDGIIPKPQGGSKSGRKRLLSLIEQHCDTVLIDADGRQNLYGLERMVIKTVAASGECLVRRRRRLRTDGLPLPFQIQVLEPDYLSPFHDAELQNGNVIREGIEFNPIGQRVAYHLFKSHPGSAPSRSWERDVKRVPAEDILHIYDVERPGQQRGVSWFASIVEKLQNLDDYDDAELLRQKISACFTAFRTSVDDTLPGTDALTGDPVAEDYDDLEMISPGRIERLPPGEEVEFASPPQSLNYDPFTKTVHRLVAAGLGITYEALTGDLRGVNFSSGRMGRMEMDRNVTAWQWLLMVPQFLQPLGAWMMEAWQQSSLTDLPPGVSVGWVPPQRMLIDPKGEIAAMVAENRAGYTSRSHSVRRLGYDPERNLEEIIQDAKDADAAKLVFDSDPRTTSANGVVQSAVEDDPPAVQPGGSNAQE